MTTVLENEKFIGGVGIAAVIVFIAAMFAVGITKNDFGSGTISDLLSENVLRVGSVIAGVLIAFFGILITFWKEESKIFIGKIRGILIIISGICLIVVGAVAGDAWAVTLFTVLAIITVISDVIYNWVVDQKLLMIISLFLAIAIAASGILSQANENNAMGFVFMIFVVVWIFYIALLRFAPVMEEDEKARRRKRKAEAREAKRKNSPAPRPYPGKGHENQTHKKAAHAEPAKEAKKPEHHKAEENHKAQEHKKPEHKGEEQHKGGEHHKPEENHKPSAGDKQKLKVMSSKEAAAARESAKKKDDSVFLVEETEAIIIAESADGKEVLVEDIDEIDIIELEEVPGGAEGRAHDGSGHGGAAAHGASKGDVVRKEGVGYNEDIDDESPAAMLRRATWNKGLRCRRDYGEHQIPVAFVKAKVAVYVEKENHEGPEDAKLRAEGWTIFRYRERDISDGKEQAEEINKAVKENLRAERASKKKKSTKK